MANLPEVNWVDDFVESIFLVAIEILRLTAMAWNMLEATSSICQVYGDPPE